MSWRSRLRHVSPLLWRLRFGTFSKITYRGLCFLTIRIAYLKRSPSLGQEKPFCSPALEKGWQGKPAHRMSCSGISDKGTFLMSPSGVSPKFFSYNSLSCLSCSLAKTHSCPSSRRARWNDPLTVRYRVLVVLCIGMSALRRTNRELFCCDTSSFQTLAPCQGKPEPARCVVRAK